MPSKPTILKFTPRTKPPPGDPLAAMLVSAAGKTDNVALKSWFLSLAAGRDVTETKRAEEKAAAERRAA